MGGASPLVAGAIPVASGVAPIFPNLFCSRNRRVPSRLAGWLFGQGIRLESPCRPVGRCFIRSYRHRPWIVFEATLTS
jgi:hypothetical protein